MYLLGSEDQKKSENKNSSIIPAIVAVGSKKLKLVSPKLQKLIAKVN